MGVVFALSPPATCQGNLQVTCSVHRHSLLCPLPACGWLETRKVDKAAVDKDYVLCLPLNCQRALKVSCKAPSKVDLCARRYSCQQRSNL